MTHKPAAVGKFRMNVCKSPGTVSLLKIRPELRE
jgi:hypothetical protein